MHLKTALLIMPKHAMTPMTCLYSSHAVRDTSQVFLGPGLYLEGRPADRETPCDRIDIDIGAEH